MRHVHISYRAGVKLARTYGESNCHGKVQQKVLLYSTPPRKVVVEEALVCEREPKNIPIDMLYAWLWKRNYHRTFALKAITGEFAVFPTGKQYRMCSNWAQEIFNWSGTRPTWSSLAHWWWYMEAYACNLRFRKPVAWPKVVSDRHNWTSYTVASVSVWAHARAHGMAHTIIRTVMF